MALFTGKGDGGTTKTFGCDQRISKSSLVAEALGALDEINSFLGLVKVKSRDAGSLGNKTIESIIHDLQESLFSVQAEVAGANKRISQEKVRELEILIETIEKELPPIKTFFISGGTELGALLDISRTIARRAERRVVALREKENIVVCSQTERDSRDQQNFPSPEALSFLNRLSSILYALARLTNHRSGIKESAPRYN